MVMTQAAAKTGVGPTALVAFEQNFPKEQHIINDDLAYRMLPFGLRAFVWMIKPRWLMDWMVRATEKDAPGLWGGMMCRKRYIDEKVIESAGQIDAVVNLGAGFDTRVYRLPALAKIPVWEIDQRKNIESKRVQLKRLFGEVPAHITLVPIDFDREELGAALASHGYSTNQRTFFIWEAVTQYLTETGIRKTFDFLAKAASGSRLAFTYVRKDFLDRRNMYGWEKAYQQYVEKEKIWIFGMDPEGWPNFLKNYNWQIIEDIGFDELTKRYVKPTGRILNSTPVERIVYAEKF
jgi:methyltransferase (TIGR00027 family)